MDFEKSFFKASAVRPPVELAPIAVNSAVVIQAGHIVGFVSLHLLRRMANGILDIFPLRY
ncbi:MAG: hypothetical protein DME55_11320 [Verrucomicrobia bacterium]|nr:MAG: hypothetical protein DME55_11320 [Verrucomicrobiota bacterium]